MFSEEAAIFFLGRLVFLAAGFGFGFGASASGPFACVNHQPPLTGNTDSSHTLPVH
jgi:hypothetical protein